VKTSVFDKIEESPNVVLSFFVEKNNMSTHFCICDEPF